MASWTAADIADLTGRVAIVTGANSGLGFETTKALAAHGATVVMACRDMSRCQAAAEEIGRSVGPERLEPEQLDLSDLESVREFAARLVGRYDSIDLLVNNAGVMAPPERLETKQGFELQLGTNHLGHFALTGLLLGQLLSAPGSRVVTVSSFAHEPGKIDFDDLQQARSYTPYGAYSQSKLANLLFMLELDRRLRRVSADTLSVGAHPGFASTNLQAAGPFLGSKPVLSWLVLGGVRLIGQPAARGAEPQLYAATAPGVQGGEYFGPKYRGRGPVAPSTMSDRARDEAVASRLWDVSKELSGVDIDEAIATSAGRSATSD
jgi:NAD(P)-dependent dehydrogenase (short-subunit alcohol dehydrogenase family)